MTTAYFKTFNLHSFDNLPIFWSMFPLYTPPKNTRKPFVFLKNRLEFTEELFQRQFFLYAFPDTLLMIHELLVYKFRNFCPRLMKPYRKIP